MAVPKSWPINLMFSLFHINELHVHTSFSTSWHTHSHTTHLYNHTFTQTCVTACYLKPTNTPKTPGIGCVLPGWFLWCCYLYGYGNPRSELDMYRSLPWKTHSLQLRIVCRLLSWGVFCFLFKGDFQILKSKMVSLKECCHWKWLIWVKFHVNFTLKFAFQIV